LVAEVENISASLPRIVEAFSRHGVEIEYIAGYGRNSKIVLVIADFSKASGNAKSLAEKLEGAPQVRRVKVISPRTRGLLILEDVMPISYSGKRAIIQSTSHFYSIIEGLGEASGGAILWHLWYRGGRHSYKTHERIRGENSVETLEDVMLSCQVSGWWKRTKIAYDGFRKAARVRIWDNWECSEIKKNLGITSKPQSQLVRGFLSGVFSEHFGVEMMAEETKCIAAGDPYCEFEIKPNTLK